MQKPKKIKEKTFSIEDVAVIVKHILIDMVGWHTSKEREVFVDSHEFLTDLGYYLRSIEVHKQNEKDVEMYKQLIKDLIKRSVN